MANASIPTKPIQTGIPTNRRLRATLTGKLGAGVCLMLLSCASTAASIRQCQSADGNVTFTHTNCPAQSQLVATIEKLNVPWLQSVPVQPAPTSDRTARPPVHNHRATKPSAAAGTSWSERQAKCAEARQRLDQLRAQRRQGYALKQAATLENRERELKSARSRYC